MKLHKQSGCASGAPATAALSAISLGVLLMASASCFAAEASEEAKSRVLRHASATRGVPGESLAVISSAEVNFPTLGIRVVKAKVMMPGSEVLKIQLDASGAEVSDELMAQYEAAARGNRRVHPSSSDGWRPLNREKGSR